MSSAEYTYWRAYDQLEYDSMTESTRMDVRLALLGLRVGQLLGAKVSLKDFLIPKKDEKKKVTKAQSIAMIKHGLAVMTLPLRMGKKGKK